MPQQQEALYREGRIALAVHAHKQDKSTSLRKITSMYDVPRSTARLRVKGIKPKRDSIAPNRRLTPAQEESLKQWILSMDQRGMPPRVATVRQMAGILAAQRAGSTTIQPIGKNWAQTFLKRHDELQSKWNRKYDYQRAKCEDPVLIREWFKRVQDAKIQYGILDDDIWNFDETGFQMGVIATARVITGTDRAGRPRTIQPGNREWVTIIEAINARGITIPPLIIFEAVMHQAAWYKDIPHDWTIGVSDNGWTTNEIGLIWLKEVFHKHTKDRTVGTHRLLVLDGHNSHVSPEFDRFCLDHQIVVLCMPAHSSHLLQPLDVGCFSVLKQSYGCLVEQMMGCGVNHIDKQEFLPLYKQARQAALHRKNIQTGFAVTGLVPYGPERVLAQLHAEYQTPSPQCRPRSNTSWIAETPHNIAELQQQTALIKRYLKQRTHSPPSPSGHAITQLVKGCEMAMSSAALLASENERLRMENQRQKRKRKQRRMYIAKRGVLSGAEGASRAQAAQNAATEAAAIEAGSAATERPQRAPRKCSMCTSTEHTARTCPRRQVTS